MPVGRLQRVLLSRSVAGCRCRTARAGYRTVVCRPERYGRAAGRSRRFVARLVSSLVRFLFRMRFSVAEDRAERCLLRSSVRADSFGSALRLFPLPAAAGNVVSGIRFGFRPCAGTEDGLPGTLFFRNESGFQGGSGACRRENDSSGRIGKNGLMKNGSGRGRGNIFRGLSRTRYFSVAWPQEGRGRRLVPAMRAFLRRSDFEALCRVPVLFPDMNRRLVRAERFSARGAGIPPAVVPPPMS